MTDIFDRASELEEADRAALIAAACKPTGPKLQPNGECHECGEPVEAPRIFCNSDCAKEFARRNK